ncbi:MAG: type II/IV secretion system ATPase subunit [Thermoplasmata archaeon]|nr:type II/IV secretion system ATPase subunit [Thermoplasmata archaeon]
MAEELKDLMERHEHLAEYIKKYVSEGGETPEYMEILTEDLVTLKKPNILYPVGDPIFIHVHYDEKKGKLYSAVEPTLSPEEREKLFRIKRMILEMAPEASDFDTKEEFKELLSRMLDKVTILRERRGLLPFLAEKRIPVTLREKKKLLYVLQRDLVEMGPIEALLRDPYLEDIHVVGLKPIAVVHKIFGMLTTNIRFRDEGELDSYVRTLGERIGKPVTETKPIIDGALPEGSRVNIIYGEEVSREGTSFTIRKFFEKPPTMPQLVRWGTFSAEMAAYLWLCLEHGMSVFVCGETASGKTTSLNAMLSFIDFHKKIYSAEDTPEVVVPQPVWQRLVTRETIFEEAKVELFDLVKTALRSRPDYIIIGEIRGKEGSAAFQAMQTGHAVLSTFHASSISKMIQRFTGDPINVPVRFIDNMNVAIFQRIVYKGGRLLRRVATIDEIIKYSKEKGGVLTRSVFRWDPVTDKHYFTGMYNSYILEGKIAPMMGLTNPKDIYKELRKRARIIRNMAEKGIVGYDEVNRIFRDYYEKGYDGIPEELLY